ncbi:MAG: DMT family transporter [Deltaproteobacteria bacterium]|nr:DMT family transporter [Deltaproteobacteria bacterium]
MAYLLLILATLFWSGNFVLGRGVNEIIPPVALAFWRWAGALVILMPFAIRGIIRQKREIRKNLGILTVLAILSVTNFNTFIYHALRTTTAINAFLVNSMTPIFIVLVSWIGFNDRINFRQTVGVVLSFIGLVWIITQGNLGILFTVRFSSGDLWTLAAALSWACYTVLLRKRPKQIDPVPFLTTLVLIGLVFLSPIYLWEIRSGASFQWSPPVYASIGYVALFPSVVAYIFWNNSVAVVGANKAGIFMHLMPVFGIILAFIFLGETLAVYHLVGMILIFTGIFLTTVNRILR